MRGYRFPVRWFLVLIGLLVTLMGLEFVAQLDFGAPLDLEGARNLIAACSRSYNQLVALMFVSVAVAIPITATSYTPKQLRLFMTDRVHRSALTFYALAAAHANWALFLVRQGTATQGLTLAVLISTIVGFAVVVPYFFYVIHFLEPGTIVRGIRDIACRQAEQAAESPAAAAKAREELASHVHHLGSVVLKSIERADRLSAVDGVAAMRHVLDRFGALKHRLPDDWFEAREAEFRGLSPAARGFITQERAWLEVYTLQQLIRGYESALTRMPDVISGIADVVKDIGLDAEARGDMAVLEDVIRTLNTFLRVATRDRAPHAIFDVLHQYKALAETLARAHPETTAAIARHFTTYGRLARRGGLPFIPDLYVYDLGNLLAFLIRGAGEYHPAYSAVHEAFDEYVRELAADAPTITLACALMVTLGQIGQHDAGARDELLDLLDALPEHLLGAAWKVVERTTSPRYYEMTHRQVDLNHLPTEQRDALADWLRARRPRVVEATRPPAAAQPA